MKRTLIAIVVVAAAFTVAADEGLQKARAVCGAVRVVERLLSESLGDWKDIQVKGAGGRFILYRGDEAVPAREVNPDDCVPASSPAAGSMPQIPCE